MNAVRSVKGSANESQPNDPRSSLDSQVEAITSDSPDMAYQHIANYLDQVTDLRNYLLHLDDVRTDLDKSAEEAPKKIEAALTDFQEALKSGESVKIHNSFYELYHRVLGPNINYRTIAERPAGKTLIVIQRKLNVAWTTADELLDQTWPLVKLKQLIDTNQMNNFRTHTTDLTYGELLHEFNQCLDKAQAKLLALKSEVARIKTEEVEPKLKAAFNQFSELQRASLQKGQQDTFRSVHYMMILLAVMFTLAVVARLIGACRRLDYYRIVNEKTLIEFGGMAFILLTIIMLGNTDKLDKQALGTLLGTIAGYIFGKGIVTASAEAHRDRLPPPSPPPAT